eukprot:TRINITY_DN4963_c0_g1_i1.p1 TRINITY_DN4963_c0_g1~~TRINITY_DN4963_c0_g1_i1.p1  ORF type:complete len:426 (-),score=85.27 TRINITY_DN4963_c0_g1_i1:92-1369(-)
MAMILSFLLSAYAVDAAYPETYSTCGVEHSVSKSPERIVTLNQGATEFMLALGLADKMVGTAYLDDYIWPQYASAYAKIPVLSSAYPNESQIMGVNPDFLVASYNSAFRAQYVDGEKTKGIFSEATVGPCVGEGSEWEGAKNTCRPQLHAAGIGTYLFGDACEDKNLRPRTVTESFVYDEMRALGRVFNVQAEALIEDMKQDFDSASGMVSTAMHDKPLKAVWLDCVGRCCKVEEGEEPQVFVGAGTGAPAMLMKEAGLENVFKATDGNWACVKESEVIAAAPDVLVVVDAAWDTAMSKITWLYNHTGFCGLDALKGARLVQIPFSATTLSPRNGPAALDLAIASVHVRTGSLTAVRESGVSSFNPRTLETHVSGLKCSILQDEVVYDKESTTTTQEPEVSSAQPRSDMWWPWVFALLTYVQARS